MDLMDNNQEKVIQKGIHLKKLTAVPLAGGYSSLARTHTIERGALQEDILVKIKKAPVETKTSPESAE